MALRSVRMFFSVYPTLFCTLVALAVLRLTVTAVKWKGAGPSRGGRARDGYVESQRIPNLFTVRHEQQQRLVDLLVEATEAVMKYQPGYVSANIHKSLDGTRVTNYAQWRSREAFEAMLKDSEANVHMQEAARIAERFEPHLYDVSFVDEA
jgi:quinol monooxygenase YgiN